MTFTEKTVTKVSTLIVDAPVNYGEEDMPNDYPGRAGDRWVFRIDLETGRIFNELSGDMPDIELYMKVRDECEYTLISEDGRVLCKRDGYVPSFFPGDHYGDYLILNIKDGHIEGWNKPSGGEIDEEFGDDDNA